MNTIIIAFLFLIIVGETATIIRMYQNNQKKIDSTETEANEIFEKYNKLADHAADLKNENDQLETKLNDLRDLYSHVVEDSAELVQKLEVEQKNNAIVRKTVEQAVELLNNIKE